MLPSGPHGRTIIMTVTIEHRRSAELEELIDQDAAAFRILTGDRPTGPAAPRPLLRHAAEPGPAAGPRRRGLRADRRLPGADRQGHGRRLDEYVTGLLLDYLAIGARPGPHDDLRAQRGARAQPAAAAVPQPGLGARAEPQPDGQGRDRALAAGVGQRADVHLPGAPGGRHPVLQGEPGAGGPGPAAAPGDHPADRAPVQRAVRPCRSSRCRTRCCRPRRCCSAPTAPR